MRRAYGKSELICRRPVQTYAACGRGHKAQGCSSKEATDPVFPLRTLAYGVAILGLLGMANWALATRTRATRDLEMSAALERGDAAAVERLILAGADPNASTPRGATPLALLTKSGDRDGVRLLLSRGAHVDGRDRDHRTPLMDAADHADTGMVALLLEHGADPNAVAEQDTPLLLAARGTVSPAAQLETVRALLDRGADIDAQDSFGHTAATWCVMDDRVDLLHLLIRRGANLRLRYHDGSSALDMATRRGYGFHPAIARLLRQAGAGHPSPVEPRLLSALRRHNSRLVDSLLREGASPDLKDRQGTPVLQLAVSAGDLATVRVLLRRGAKVDARDRKGATALMRAAETAKQDPALVNLLLAVGADPEVKDREGDTALAYARRADSPAALGALGAASSAPAAGNGK